MGRARVQPIDGLLSPRFIQPAALAVTSHADCTRLPALIADIGDAAGWRYVKFSHDCRQKTCSGRGRKISPQPQSNVPQC